jgi:hypothetical protein
MTMALKWGDLPESDPIFSGMPHLVFRSDPPESTPSIPMADWLWVNIHPWGMVHKPDCGYVLGANHDRTLGPPYELVPSVLVPPHKRRCSFCH